MIIFNFGRCNLNTNNKTILSAGLLLFSFVAKAQLPETNQFQSKIHFKTEHSVKDTEVKNQHNTSTCWSFSSLSMLESEAIREGKPAVNLSEMFIVRHVYLKKAENYVRMHGHANFAPGGAFHDVTNAIREFGIVPETVYPGNLSMNRHDHSELDAALKVYLENLVKNENRISGNWRAAVNGILDAYLGKLPEKFDFNGKSYTALSFAGFMGIHPDDYLEFTSFTHHPKYSSFVLEVPDNWSWDRVWNVSLSELKEITDFALSRNYSIAWGADVSEKGFSFKNGLALVPEKDYESQMDMEKDSVFMKPVGEKIITEEMRQMAFDDFRTQDDHGMHITALAKDQSGKQWYAVKNSWGSDRNYCRGYFYCSVPYYQYKTTSIMVHKSGVPPAILAKLKL